MPLINPDTSAALDFSPLEPGTYKATIRKVEVQTSTKGNPMIVPEFEVQVPGSNPRNRKAFLVISGEGSYGFGQLLRACGFTKEADAYADPTAQKPAFDTDALIGQEVNLIIDSTVYKDQKRDEIKSYLPA